MRNFRNFQNELIQQLEISGCFRKPMWSKIYIPNGYQCENFGENLADKSFHENFDILRKKIRFQRNLDFGPNFDFFLFTKMSIFWPKHWFLDFSQNFGQKSIFCSKTQIFVNKFYSPKIKFFVKKICLPKNQNSAQKSNFFEFLIKFCWAILFFILI